MPKAKKAKKAKIRVGRDYQAVPPPFIPKTDRRGDQGPERSLLAWSPPTTISDARRKFSIHLISDLISVSLLSPPSNYNYFLSCRVYPGGSG